MREIAKGLNDTVKRLLYGMDAIERKHERRVNELVSKIDHATIGRVLIGAGSGGRPLGETVDRIIKYLKTSQGRVAEKDAEIERLKGYNDEALKVLKKERVLAKSIIKERDAEIDASRDHRFKLVKKVADVRKEQEHWQLKYNRLVSCVKRCDKTGMSVCDILSIHRDNEAKLKEQRAKRKVTG